MSHLPRHQSPINAYADISDYEIYSRPRKVTVTIYGIYTSTEHTISYHDRRANTAYESHQSASDCRGLSNEGHRDPKVRPRYEYHLPEASYTKSSAEYRQLDRSRRVSRKTGAQRDDRHGQSDRHYISEDDTMPKHARQSQPEELKAAHTSGSSGRSRSHGSDKHKGSDNLNRETLKKSGSRYEEKHPRRQEDSRSSRNDPFYKDREQRSYPGFPRPSQPKEPKSTPRAGQNSKPKSYSYHKETKNDKPSQRIPESGSHRRQEKPHKSRSESRRGKIPGSNRNGSSHEVPQRDAEEILPDYYAFLKLHHLATPAEIKSAAKRRRVEVHPDKLKKPGMSDSEQAKIDGEAAKVGEAADVLQNPQQKWEYDRQLYAAKGWIWHSSI